MKRFGLVLGVLVALGMARGMYADITDYMLNINGTTYCPSGTAASCSNNGGLAAAPGTVSSLNTAYLGTGLGTVTVTFNPGAGGPYNVNLWTYENLQTPAYNEYGATGGTPTANQAGLSWQIDVPDYDYAGELAPTNAGNIIANTAASTLGNVNNVPGQTSDYLASCIGPTCNDFVSTALGFNFSLGANQKEVISFTVSNTAPTSGFYLEQIHPVDGSNTSATDYFFTGTAMAVPVTVSTTPEPGFILPLGAAMGLLFWLRRSRSTAVDKSR